ETKDAAGKSDWFNVLEDFGKKDWKSLNKTIELPRGTVSARFRVQLNKTYGRFWLGELAASYLAPAPRRDDRIVRMLFSTARLGNLLFPNDPRQVAITVEAKKPLRDDQLKLTCVVRDYWGAEQEGPLTAQLASPEKRGDRYIYQAVLDLRFPPDI